jgi:rod shape-determining protein MreC
MARSARSGSVTGSVFDNSLLGICVIASAVMLFLPATIRGRSAAALRRSVAAPFVELQRRAELSRAAFLSYNDRMQRVGEVARTQRELVALQGENAQLRTLLGLGTRLKWGFLVAEASPSGLESSLVAQQTLQTFNVTAGSRSGVQAFTPVVNDRGLVGMVQSVDASTGQAISYLHPDFRVSATTPNDSAVGIVQAHLVGSGAERGLLEMRGVPFRSPLKTGQLIISSGLGGTYPRGIFVGTVIREIQTAEKWARTYLLQPSAPLASIGPVFLLSKKRADEGMDGVWSSASGADSAARAVAAAGDSLARQAALSEMAARRAALDSMQNSVPGDSSAPRSAPTGTTPATPPARASTAVPTPPNATPNATVPNATPRPTTPAAPTPTTRPPATAPANPPVRRPATDTARAPGQPTVPRPTVPRPTVPRPTVPRP